VRAVAVYLTPLAFEIPFAIVPPAFHNCLSCGLPPGATPAALPYPILRRLSSTSESRAAPHAPWHGGAAGGGWGWRQKAV